MTSTRTLHYWFTAVVLGVMLLSVPAAHALIPSTISVTANPTIVSFGAQVPLTVTVTANDDVGVNSEYWVVVTDPASNKYSHNGTTWISGLSIYGSGPLADFATVLTTSPLTATGLYVVEVIIDFNVDGSLDTGPVSDTLVITVNSQVQVLPSLLVTVNGSSNPTVTIGDTAAIRLQMDPGTYNGTLAEWWIIVAEPGGGKYYYDSLSPWIYDPVGLPVAPTMFGFNPVIAVDTTLISPVLSIPGTYTVYFGLDPTFDGDADLAVFDSAQINVPGNLPSVGLAWGFGSPTSPQMWPGTVGTPLVAFLDLSVYAGDYGAMDGELWLVTVKPDGTKLYWDPTIPILGDWGVPIWNDQDSLGGLAFTWHGATVPTPNMDSYGTWSFYLLIDNDQNGAIDLDFYIYDKLSFEIGTDPTIDVYPYKSPWSISGDAPADLGVWAYIYPGLYGSTYADFWVSAVSPVGVFSSLKVFNGWVIGIDYYEQDLVDNVKDGVISHDFITPVYDPEDPSQAHHGWNYVKIPLFGKLNSMTGTWTVYFGIDNLNGWVDSNIIYDTQTIVIAP